MDEYVKFLQGDKENTEKYYLKSLEKTEQQKALEMLLAGKGMKGAMQIADIACGAGTLTHHLSKQYPEATFSLLDYNSDALELARKINPGERFSFHEGDIYHLPFPDNSFDVVFCWQTLSWLEHPENAIKELMRITRPKGSVWMSSLFNLDHDVDLYTNAIDHTHLSGKQSQTVRYNTYSRTSVAAWLEGQSCDHQFHRFVPSIDFKSSGKGLGTYTVSTPDGRIQISGGILMNWAILEILKH
ncbi:MAG: methyltransferase domain-containing protein [Flavobacteriales bacterium]|nr:methyltransferase domain-containing protein [Flavobacteriales bacterium]